MNEDTSTAISELSKLLSKISSNTVLLFITILINTLFWFVSIYLISPDFYCKNPIWINSFVSIVLAINHWISGVVFAYFYTVYFLKLTPGINHSISTTFLLAELFLMFQVSLYMVVCYYFHLSYMWFLLFNYLLIAPFFIFLLINLIRSNILIYKNTKENNHKKDIEQEI